MALTDTQIAQRLLKKGLGVAETNYPLAIRGILEEAIPTYSIVTSESIWEESSSIPSTPPTLGDEGESGVVKYYEKLQLIITDAGTTVAFKSPLGQLENAISGQFGFGYNYKVYGNSGNTQIFKGDWLVDSESGVLIFYNPDLAETTVDATHQPYITFYKYIGTTGFTDLTSSISAETSNRISEDASLSTAISVISGSTLDISTIVSDNQLLGIVGGNLTGVSYSTVVSSEASTRNSEDTSLSTSISSEISSRSSADTSLSTIISIISGTTGGDVYKVGTPIDNQIGIWTGNGTIEGSSGLTYDTGKLYVDELHSLDGTIGSVSGKTLTIKAGNPYSTTGADAGNLILKAGDAISGDTSSISGYLYLVPGNHASNTESWVYIGDNYSTNGTLYIQAEGIPSNVNLTIAAKGSAALTLGTNNGSIVASTIFQANNDIIFGNSRDAVLEGVANGITGYTLTIRGGSADNSGNNPGGNLYLYGGAPGLAGQRGDVYFGDGSTAYLSSKTTETNIVYYDTTSGKLSYGIVSGGTGGVTPTSNILFWDSGTTAYTPYSVQSSGKFDSSVVDPSHTNRLNYDGNLWTTNTIATTSISAPLITTTGNYAQIHDIPTSTVILVQSTTGKSIRALSQSGNSLELGRYSTSTSSVTASMLLMTDTCDYGTENVNYTFIDITSNPTTTGYISGSTLKSTIGATVRIDMNPRAIDSGTSVAYMFDTNTGLTTSGAKLFELRNFGIPKFYVDLSGNTVTSGITISANTRRITLITLTSGGTTTWDMNLSSSAQVTISGSTTLAISNVISGDNGTLIIIQNGIGTFTFPASSKYSGGTGAPTLTGSGAIDILSFFYDGTYYYWNIGRNYTT
jgi:hypothetical protein